MKKRKMEYSIEIRKKNIDLPKVDVSNRIML